MALARPKNGELILGSFESEEFSQWEGPSIAAETTLVKQGTQSLKINQPTGGQKIIKRRLPRTIDSARISAGDTFSIWVWLSKVPNNWLRIALINDVPIAGGSGNILRRDVPIGGLVVGWNKITWTKSAMATFGTWATYPIIRGVQLDWYHNVSEDVTIIYDDFRVQTSETRQLV